MAKPDLGTKRVCPTTGRKFYDLNKDPVVSPYTGQSYPRSFFEPLSKIAKPEPEEEEELETPAVVELVPLEEAEATPESEAVDPVAEVDADVDADIDADDDDTFLEEEEGDDDVADLIDGDIEDDEEP